jgi:hypothetical protein
MAVEVAAAAGCWLADDLRFAASGLFSPASPVIGIFSSVDMRNLLAPM